MNNTAKSLPITRSTIVAALLTLDFDEASEQWDALKDDKAEGHKEFKVD